MKKIEDIVKIDFQELERIADDTAVTIPDSLGDRVKDALLSSMLQRRRHRRKETIGFAILAPVAVAAALGLILWTRPPKLQDTFDDPALAYAQLEETFTYISDQIEKGLDIADEATPAINKPAEILKKTLKK